MARFIGGPYDGRDMPFDPCVLRKLNLPEKDHIEEFLSAHDTTTLKRWPHYYEADNQQQPPVYRFVESRYPDPKR